MAIGAHQKTIGDSDDYLTPPPIFWGGQERKFVYDVDPCCPWNMPWDTASKMVTNQSTPQKEFPRGIHLQKEGIVEVSPNSTVWCNPPYSDIELWMGWMARHWNGVALVFARTETQWFHKFVWAAASSVVFLEGRIHFCDLDGDPLPANAGGPSCLVGFGSVADHVLERFVKSDPDLEWRGKMKNLRAGKLVRL